jgi:hypothetical protein
MRLTLLFYAAFGVYHAQGRYTSPDFYRWVVGEWFQIALDLLIFASFLVLTLGALIRSLRARSLPWWHGATALGAILLAEFVWRYGVNNLPGLGFKDVAIAVDATKPIVAALGVAAIIAERKAHAAKPSSVHSNEATV